MQLYYATGTISLAVATALEEPGVAYETVKVNFAAKEQANSGYEQINPQGRGHALVVDGGLLHKTGA